MALTGFNPEVVNTSISAVKSAYSELMNSLYNGVQKTFIGGMSDKWACNQAQTFFAGVVEGMNGLCYSGTGSINTVFESVVASMNSAAQAWAQETESSYTPQSFDAFTQNYDSSAIVENIAGVRGIDLEQASPVAATLTTTAESATAALSSAQSAVQNSGFIGGNMQESLISSLERIKGNISNAFNGFTDNAKRAIDETVASYGDTEGKVSQAFTGNN